MEIENIDCCDCCGEETETSWDIGAYIFCYNCYSSAARYAAKSGIGADIKEKIDGEDQGDCCDNYDCWRHRKEDEIWNDVDGYSFCDDCYYRLGDCARNVL